ncbi:tetratricopeptide repeat protein [Epibacterium ulvae]|uniref:O-linked N-acetylglucosamine transferase, SPINDLY family protein n=1 Tax=Epibacterium ulvae TaxID=1156985 RepID=UPI002491A60B|nr:tetratricopeptide repeat protein [Epibacterium ulvae]
MTASVSMTNARSLEQDHKLEDAAKAYGEILSRYPQNEDARAALASLRDRMQHIDEPPRDILDTITNNFERGDIAAAASQCASELNRYRKSYALWATLGHCHLKRGALNEAATCLNKAIELGPDKADAYAFMALVSHRQGNLANATALYRKALQLDPQHFLALQELGQILLRSDTPDQGIAHLKSACARAPENARAQFALGCALRQMGRLQEAETAFAAALTADPDYTAALANLGELRLLKEDYESARDAFLQVCKKEPQNDRARAAKFHAMAHLGDWSWTSEYDSQRRYLGLQGTPCNPQHLVHLEDNPDLLRLRTQAFAAQAFQVSAGAIQTKPSAAARIKLGYFCSNPHQTNTSAALETLTLGHDTSQFEVFLYTTASDDIDQDLPIDGVEHHRDFSGAGEAEILTQITADQLDIAIDLTGYTSEMRSPFFSQRVAPLQIALPGYLGTMGSTQYDYLITDAKACPAGSERYFDEFLVRMPHSAHVPTPDLATAAPRKTRTECGLPDDGFVFCSFNDISQIDKNLFGTWMELLKTVEHSVLWLGPTSEIAQANLKNAAESYGIDTKRIVFAADAESEQQRHLADLFLDTILVNGTTKVSEALWDGLPVLTVAGKQLAARTSASKLQSLQLHELIATSLSAYKTAALSLAKNPEELKSLRRRLAQNKAISPLFDRRQYLKDLERAFDTMIARHRQGLPPDHLDLAKAIPSGAVAPSSRIA